MPSSKLKCPRPLLTNGRPLSVFLNTIMSSLLIFVALVLLAAYGAWGLTLFFIQPKLLYNPLREVTCTPVAMGLDFEDAVFTSSDGLRLSGWYIPAQNSELTILLCHGNAGNMMHHLEIINAIYNLGISCLIFDYRGYGDSEGRPSEKGTYLDAEAAYKWLTDVKKVLPDEIIIFGRSLGGSIAAHLASKVRAKALVLESAFTSYVDIGRKFYPYMPVRWFARFSYRTIDFIKNIHCPVLLIYSKDDEIIPFEFGLRLYEAANEPKEFIEISGSHNGSFIESNKTYEQAWKKWLELLKQYKLQSTHQKAC